MTIAKTDQRVSVIVVDGVPLFFQLEKGPYFTLKLLHKFPDCMPKLRVDRVPSSRLRRREHHVPGHLPGGGGARRRPRGHSGGNLR